MSILDAIFKSSPTVETLGLSSDGYQLKKAFDAARFGQAGVPQYPDTDRLSLIAWQRRNEVVYSCIRKKCEAASDPELIVEKRNGKGEWETYDGHPLSALLEKPNPDDTWDTFMAAWVASEEVSGDFYAEIVRDGSGVPTALYPLNPSCMYPIPAATGSISHYEFRSGYSPIITLDLKDVLHRRKPDLASRYFGLAPLKVAIGSVDADQAQTDFTRAFFHSDGVPAGILKINNQSLSQEEAAHHQQHWMAKYRRGGSQHKQVAVLDQNAEFQTIGTNLKDIEGDVTRGQVESRICMVFGVPPALIGAYVGLKLATNNATMKTHMADFWLNTMSPMLKTMRVFLTWTLLPEFESLDLIKQKKVRVNWDMSQVMAMQEDDNARHNRARDNFLAGITTLNEARDQVGEEPIDDGDYFQQPANMKVMTEVVRALVASAQSQPPAPAQPALPANDPAAEPPPPKQITDGKIKKVLTEMVVDAMAEERTEGERLGSLEEYRKVFALPLIEGELLDAKVAASIVNEDGSELETEITVRQRQAQLQKKSDVLMGMLERLYVENS